MKQEKSKKDSIERKKKLEGGVLKQRNNMALVLNLIPSTTLKPLNLTSFIA
jgi:hypothetical protein